MAITASGLFGLTLEKMLIDSLGKSLESETDLKGALLLDTATPNFDTMNFWDDLEGDEASGTGYTAEGAQLTSTEVTVSSGTLTYDAADSAWATSTITSAMAEVGIVDRGGATSADELVFLSDFVSAASSSGGTFTIQRSASGIFTVDYTP
jgi:hypothetical protein